MSTNDEQLALGFSDAPKPPSTPIGNVSDAAHVNAYIIVSLKKYAVDLMTSGKKRYEYRTRFGSRQVIAFIYCTSPIMAITHVVLFGQPIRGTAEEIANIAERDQPGRYQLVFDYLRPNGKGVAIPILAIREIPPHKLSDLRAQFGFIAPQSFINLNPQSPLGAALIPDCRRAFGLQPLDVEQKGP